MADHGETSTFTSGRIPSGGPPGVLTREELRERILADPPLISEWRDLDAQLQPNGFDFTVGELYRLNGGGMIGVDNADRALPALLPMSFETDDWVRLQPGCYQAVFNEIVNLPLELMALARPRSSLNRCGVTIHTAVWDAGYRGRSTALLSVLNPAGFRVQRHARVLQAVFLTVSRLPTEGYAGAYQGENINR